MATCANAIALFQVRFRKRRIGGHHGSERFALATHFAQSHDEFDPEFVQEHAEFYPAQS